jgi:D-3-phosphoglycerate dehydrogenase
MPLPMPRIVVTDATFPRLDHEKAVAARYGANLEEACCSSADDVLKAAAGTDVLLVQFAQITSEAIDRLAPNAAIVRYGLGLDNIDLKSARRKGIRVAYVPDYATGEVADHTVALILAALRKIIPLDRSVRNGRWDPVGVAKPIQTFSSSTVGFIGFGRIGREVHARLKPFGFRSIVTDPFADVAQVNAAGAIPVDLDTLFTMADVITLHTPLTNETRHVVNASRLGTMKSTAIIVNTARGGLIDLAALEEALAAGRIGGAALDVFEQEPLPLTCRLKNLENVILTPHVAWYSEQSTDRVQSLAADEVDRALSGKPARCPAPI